jgi:hypothetical protein
MVVYKMDCYKVKLVAHGFTQTYGLDYIKTFVLVARLDSIWIILAIVIIENMHMVQFDIKTTLFMVTFLKNYTWAKQKGLKIFFLHIKCTSFKNPFMN